MRRDERRVLDCRIPRFLLAALLIALATAAPAAAKTYFISNANETFVIKADGSVEATEQLTFDFDGRFHGAFRLIPVARAESIDHVGVSEGGVPYLPGANAAVGSSGSVRTFGVLSTPEGVDQVAWHFSAGVGKRTFTVTYRMHGFVDAYPDIGDLYLQVWGDQWTVPCDHLHAVVILPGPVTTSEHDQLRVWGHPGSVRGDVKIAGADRVEVDATSIPSQQAVEIDTTFPRRLLSPSGSFVKHPVSGLPLIVAREQRIFASPYGPSPSPVGGGGGSGGILGWIVFIIFLPFILIGRLFGFFRGGSSGSGASGFGGALGGFGGSFGGGGGGGGGAW